MTWTTPAGARLRVVSDNDYSGDPDGLVQLAHHALSGSVELVAVVGTHLRPGDPFDPSEVTADHAAAEASEVLRLAGRTDVRVVAGSNVGLADRRTPIASDGVRAILEAAHVDDPRPLFVCCGAGLTEIASAWLTDPSIASKLTVVWIGGAEHAGVEAPPGAPASEYNTAINPMAAQVVLNDSDLVVWQVPRDAYRQALTSFPELDAHLTGPLGRHLFDRLDGIARMAAGVGFDLGEIYVLGDSPLVLLTALQSSFEAWPSSSESVLLPAPVLADDGSYTGAVMEGRLLRVWTRLDCSLLMRDLYAKLDGR
jgi:purine nucleosidase